MPKQSGPRPKIEYVEPPPIKWYGVSGDQLQRIKESCSSVGHDLSFALSSVSVGVTLIVTALTISQLTSVQQITFWVLAGICGVVFLYTGIRWLRSCNRACVIIESIQNESNAPEGDADA
ncbi:MAG: hypothetical protein DHS20C14_17020 [Phycisphaeraceae bacterium]|nr:MAG: hypothetical protein DHS20C14_17020 [Phycisphaeraceae bacterium]